MNRSYSKIRHIQEANKMLEKRLLSETDQNTEINDEDSLGNAIIQCYADSRSKEEMIKLLNDNTNFFNRRKFIRMIEDDIDAFANAGYLENTIELGKHFFKKPNFVSSVLELLKKYNIRVRPKG